MVLRLAHNFLSVLTLFSNKNVVHSIKSLFMLQEMAAKDSVFWSALKAPLHGWHFSSIFSQPYLASWCPVSCSACPWTIVQQIEFPCATEGLKCSELFPEGQRRHCRGQEGLAQLGSLLQPLGNAPGFPSGRSRTGAAVGTPPTAAQQMQPSLITPTKGSSGGTQEQGQVSGATARAGCDHKTLCNTQKAAWERKKRILLFLWAGKGCEVVKTGYQVYWGRATEEHKAPGSALPSSPRPTLVPDCPIPALGMSQLSQPLFWFGDFLRGLWDLGTPQFPGLRHSGCSEKLTWAKKKKKAECVGLKFGKSPSSLSRLSP